MQVPSLLTVRGKNESSETDSRFSYTQNNKPGNLCRWFSYTQNNKPGNLCWRHLRPQSWLKYLQEPWRFGRWIHQWWTEWNRGCGQSLGKYGLLTIFVADHQAQCSPPPLDTGTGRLMNFSSTPYLLIFFLCICTWWPQRAHALLIKLYRFKKVYRLGRESIFGGFQIFRDSPSQPSTKLFNLCGKRWLCNFVPCLGNGGYQTQFGAQDINSACTVAEVGPQRAVDEPPNSYMWHFDSTISYTCKTAGHIPVPGWTKMRESNPGLRVSVWKEPIACVTRAMRETWQACRRCDFLISAHQQWCLYSCTAGNQQQTTKVKLAAEAAIARSLATWYSWSSTPIW